MSDEAQQARVLRATGDSTGHPGRALAVVPLAPLLLKQEHLAQSLNGSEPSAGRDWTSIAVRGVSRTASWSHRAAWSQRGRPSAKLTSEDMHWPGESGCSGRGMAQQGHG